MESGILEFLYRILLFLESSCYENEYSGVVWMVALAIHILLPGYFKQIAC